MSVAYPIITLCGSTRFKRAYIDWYARLTGQGAIVLSVGRFLPKPQHTTEHKDFLDRLHLAKIEASDGIFVLDVDGYIGESTRKEILYAKKKNKSVQRLSRAYPGYKEPDWLDLEITQAIIEERISSMSVESLLNLGVLR